MKNIVVFCGSNSSIGEVYLNAATGKNINTLFTVYKKFN